MTIVIGPSTWSELMSINPTIGLLFVGAVKDKYYDDKPETIDALKNNIREAIWEIQMHTIDNVLKNWNDHIGYCMASRGSHLNEIIFYY